MWAPVSALRMMAWPSMVPTATVVVNAAEAAEEGRTAIAAATLAVMAPLLGSSGRVTARKGRRGGQLLRNG